MKLLALALLALIAAALLSFNYRLQVIYKLKPSADTSQYGACWTEPNDETVYCTK